MRRTKKELLGNIKDPIKSSKIVNNNTIKIEYQNGKIAYRLHDTDVVVENPDKSITLNSGGWKTVITKDRINKYSPYNVSQVKGIWYINGSMFYDGITLKGDRILTGKKAPDLKKINKLKKDIKNYCDLVTKDNLLTPNSGDCWFCSLRTDKGVTMGDCSKDNNHLLEHIREGYLHGSILVNAMRDYGYRDQQISFHYSLGYFGTFKRALRKYLQKKLINW